MTALTRSNFETQPQSCQKLSIAKQYLDQHCPLDHGSHQQATHYVVYYNHLMAFFADGSHCGLKYPKQFVALCGHRDDPSAILLKKADNLHIEIAFNRCGETGKIDHANIDDIQVETQLSSVDQQAQHTQLNRLWMSFLTGVQTATLCKQYTAKDGSDYLL
ncbi:MULTISPECIES: malate synthase [Pseudoalteromonas]|uniref:Malate synthase n=1 Tax=Pseudoalteromonas amylolytica TaxID=1859457 RepID=A0A1S1MPR6_9GAMM|nr:MULTISPECIES: malate synthase [Pseudoalteromonas]OHU84908.1 malate synthase [Pseudoalteromonas sp. JW3]OHU90141.1 malate synthase [Pseudoalteromonas amylolytica]